MEIKREIAQIVDTLSPEQLIEVRQYVQKVQKRTPQKIQLSTHLQTILVEDKELLEKLAK